MTDMELFFKLVTEGRYDRALVHMRLQTPGYLHDFRRELDKADALAVQMLREKGHDTDE